MKAKRKKIKTKSTLRFINKGKTSMGTIIISLGIVMTMATVLVGAELPHIKPVEEGKQVVLVSSSMENPKDSLQLYHFQGLTITPVPPTSPPDVGNPTPQASTMTTTCQNYSDVDVMVVIDVSLSTGSGVKTAASGFIDFVSKNPQSRVGIVTFAKSAKLHSKLSSDFPAVKQVLNQGLSGGIGIGSCLSCGVNEANNEMKANGRPNTKKAVIFISDGKPFGDSDKATLDAANQGFAQNKTNFYTIAVGGFMGIGTNLLSMMATGTGGRYYPGSSNLSEIMSQIGSQLLCKT